MCKQSALISSSHLPLATEDNSYTALAIQLIFKALPLPEPLGQRLGK